jgi:hypothetical protein
MQNASKKNNSIQLVQTGGCVVTIIIEHLSEQMYELGFEKRRGQWSAVNIFPFSFRQ